MRSLPYRRFQRKNGSGHQIKIVRWEEGERKGGGGKEREINAETQRRRGRRESEEGSKEKRYPSLRSG